MNVPWYSIFTLGLLWGSFLNVVAYRLIRNLSIIRPRSYCPACKHTLAWYDLIPVISWLLLRGKCRYCKASISWLYPAIELLAACSFTVLYSTISHHYFPAYALFFSALIITIRTDIEDLLISRFATLALIPIGIACAIFGALPLDLYLSLIGIIIGYGFLWITAFLFYRFTGRHGMGQGDLELMACIGAFTGPLGVWIVLTLGTISGLIGTLIYLMLFKRSRSIKIPFGLFLAAGALVYVLYEPFFINFLLPTQ